MAFDFWAPTFVASDGSLYSPGFTGNTFMDSSWDKVFFASAPTPGIAEVSVQRERAYDEKKAAGSDGARGTVHGSRPARIEIRLTIWTPEQLRALNDLWPILMTPPYKTVTTDATSFTNPSPTSVSNIVSGSTTTIPSAVPGIGNQPVSRSVVVNPTTGSTISVPVVATKTQKLTSRQAVTFDVSHPAFKIHGVKAVQILGGSGPEPGRISRSKQFVIRAIEYAPPGKGNATKTDVSPIGSVYDPGAYPTAGSDPGNTGP